MDIDLNADLGEGAGTDAELMPLITSANVCCGLHAGSPQTVWDTFKLARDHGVVVGAHPGFADREHFGRRELAMLACDMQGLAIYQIGALRDIAWWMEMEVRYIKLHGALYNLACRETEVAYHMASMAETYGLPIVGLPGSRLEESCQKFGAQFIPEGFADRLYRPDGSLVPRTEPDAFVHDPDEAVKQVEWLIREKGVRTVCVHGDNPEAVTFTKAVREALLACGFALKPFA